MGSWCRGGAAHRHRARWARGPSFASWRSSSEERHRLPTGSLKYEPPSAVTFLGESGTVVSHDRITFDTIATGTRVTYDAELRLKGLLRVADPLLALAFNRVGDRALGGLRAVLGQTTDGAVDAAA